MHPRFQWLAPPEYFIPPPLRENAEEARRARLIVGFGVVGGIFGAIYASFYLLIGHVWGAAIIIGCTAAMASVPWVLKRTAKLALTGNLHSFVLFLGFCGLSAIEGGVRGHAVAWLASVPLCALLLVSSRAAIFWCAACFLATLFFCLLEGLNIDAPILYPSRWHSVVTAAGFLGLVIFMSVIGVIFELGRKRAFQGMKDALQEVSETNEQLVLISAEKDELLGIAAHDLKNPLNVILGFAKLIQTTDRTSVERIQRDVGEIVKASTQMRRLISDLLDLHAMEEGRFPLKLDFMDLGETAAGAVDNFRTVAAEKQIALRLELPHDPPLVKADMRAILQILENLISNALKFSAHGTQVIVSVKEESDQAVLEVRDEGPGLSEEDQVRLFEKFARLSARPTAGESSNGLGLSIVKRLVEAMGGTVSCRSRLGEGASFAVRLRAFEIGDLMGHVEGDEERGADRARSGGGLGGMDGAGFSPQTSRNPV